MARNLSTYGIYPTMSALHTGAEALKAEGFRQADISVMYSDKSGTKEFAHEAHTKAPEGAAAGAATATIGGVVGYLANVGALTMPGLAPLLAAGPIAASLAGVGAAGAAGGLVSALVGLGIPEYEAKRFEGRMREGGILLSVYCDDSGWADRARGILERTGADHVAVAAEKAADYQP